MIKKSWWFYPVILFLFSIYSYSQVTPNLVLSSHPWYWNFQLKMWHLGFVLRPISTAIFIILIVLSFIAYFWLIRSIQRGLLNLRQVLVIFGLCVMALIPSYPGLSNDIFNYLMNARMMVVYHASPYQHAAWDFPDDPWLKFMMNVHTSTPYGYIWTGLGYLMYVLSFGDLQFGMLAFRLLAIFSVLIISYSIWNLCEQKKRLEMMGYFMFNPLVLYEAINNTHNDITMMALFMGGIALFFRYKSSGMVKSLVILLFAWIMSVYTKLITVISPAVYLFSFLVKRFVPWFNWADYLTAAFVFAQFGDGSKRFYPWYLLWALPLAPLAKSAFTRNVMIAFSFSGMLSYVFFLYTGIYNDVLGLNRIRFLFIIPLVYCLFAAIEYMYLSRKKFS